MYKILPILMVGMLLTGCSFFGGEALKNKIDINKNVVSCIVFNDHTECLMSNGETYYGMNADILPKLKWDESAWKEEVVEVMNVTVMDSNETINMTSNVTNGTMQ